MNSIDRLPTLSNGPAAVALRDRPLALAASLHQRALGLRREAGQGTVEYVALAMLIAALMAGVVVVMAKSNGGGISDVVLKKIKDAINYGGKAPK